MSSFSPRRIVELSLKEITQEDQLAEDPDCPMVIESMTGIAEAPTKFDDKLYRILMTSYPTEQSQFN